MTPADAVLVDLLGALDAADYDFVAVTPLSHRRIVERGPVPTSSVVRRLFGWSLAVAEADIPPAIFAAMIAAEIVMRDDDSVRSALRVARIGGDLCLHSAFPTDDANAVFLGPDSYRFARLVRDELRDRPAGGFAVDIGTGAGVGALALAAALESAEIVATDINPAALRLARINAAHAGRRISFVEAGDLTAIDRPIDVAVANPPYLVDGGERRYRHGGGGLGTAVALDMATQAMARLAPGGRLILYTGSPIVDGGDPLRAALTDAAAGHGCSLRYHELDPDVFGEELDRDAYADVERIALIAAVVDRS